MEIERKFLTDGFPYSLTGYKKLEITQGYILFDPEVRVRKENDKYFYTSKIGTGLVREEKEREIDEATYSFYIKDVKGIVKKTRYLIPLTNDLIAEYDVYQDNLLGLKTVEVEFDTVEDAENFIIPVWFGGEITGIKMYQNSNLSRLKKTLMKKQDCQK